MKKKIVFAFISKRSDAWFEHKENGKKYFGYKHQYGFVLFGQTIYLFTVLDVKL